MFQQRRDMCELGRVPARSAHEMPEQLGCIETDTDRKVVWMISCDQVTLRHEMDPRIAPARAGVRVQRGELGCASLGFRALNPEKRLTSARDDLIRHVDPVPVPKKSGRSELRAYT